MLLLTVTPPVVEAPVSHVEERATDLRAVLVREMISMPRYQRKQVNERLDIYERRSSVRSTQR